MLINIIFIWLKSNKTFKNMKCYYLFKPWLHTAPQGTSGKWKAGIKNGFTFNGSGPQMLHLN